MTSHTDATTEAPIATRATRQLVEAALAAAVFLGSYIVLFDVAIDIRMASDYPFHFERAGQFAARGSGLPPHPLFHVLTATVSRLTGLAIEMSGMLLLCFSLAVSALVIHRLILGAAGPAASKRELWTAATLTLLSLLAQPIFLPSFNEIYVGQSSPNVWHNPTNMLLKPLALLGAVCLERVVFGQPSRRDHVVIFATALIGILAKPAFALVLIPVTGALAAYLYLPERYRQHSGTLQLRVESREFLAALAVITLAAIVAQSRLILADGGMQILLLTVWRAYTTSVPLSILLVAAFPLSVTLVELSRHGQTRGLGLAWGFTLAGMAILSIFAETGTRVLHGNFGWSYQIALAVLYPFAMRSYWRIWRESAGSSGFLVTSGVLAAHLVSGVYYLYQLMVLHYYV